MLCDAKSCPETNEIFLAQMVKYFLACSSEIYGRDDVRLCLTFHHGIDVAEAGLGLTRAPLAPLRQITCLTASKAASEEIEKIL